MYKTLVMLGVIIFCLGFCSAMVVLTSGITVSISEYPYFLSSPSDSPSDYIFEEDIEIFEDRVVIHISGASLSQYAPTGSMVPVLDSGANGIRIIPESSDEILVGDLVTFDDGESLVIHRVVSKGSDDDGIYFITKGDNNAASDGKIRFESILYKTIGLLY